MRVDPRPLNESSQSEILSCVGTLTVVVFRNGNNTDAFVLGMASGKTETRLCTARTQLTGVLIFYYQKMHSNDQSETHEIGNFRGIKQAIDQSIAEVRESTLESALRALLLAILS